VEKGHKFAICKFIKIYYAQSSLHSSYIAGTMASGPLRVGLLGVAGISSKTALAISNPETGCEVRAVASRSQEKAEVWLSLFLLLICGWISVRSAIPHNNVSFTEFH
jgi:hypothetical protein